MNNRIYEYIHDFYTINNIYNLVNLFWKPQIIVSLNSLIPLSNRTMENAPTISATLMCYERIRSSIDNAVIKLGWNGITNVEIDLNWPEAIYTLVHLLEISEFFNFNYVNGFLYN